MENNKYYYLKKINNLNILKIIKIKKKKIKQ